MTRKEFNRMVRKMGRDAENARKEREFLESCREKIEHRYGLKPRKRGGEC